MSTNIKPSLDCKIRRRTTSSDTTGSFCQSNKHSVVLEYANGGTLWQLLQQDGRPTTAPDRLRFWESFSGYFKGLHRVHQINEDYLGYTHLPNYLVISQAVDRLIGFASRGSGTWRHQTRQPASLAGHFGRPLRLYSQDSRLRL